MSDKTSLSLPKSKKVCGYDIKKLPIGAYLKAINSIKSFPNEVIESCFPENSFEEVLDKLAEFDGLIIKQFLSSFIDIAPDYFFDLIEELTAIPKERLINDENIGLDGLLDILTAFAEVNSLGKFIAGVKQITSKTRHKIKTVNTGFKD